MNLRYGKHVNKRNKLSSNARYDMTKAGWFNELNEFNIVINGKYNDINDSYKDDSDDSYEEDFNFKISKVRDTF